MRRKPDAFAMCVGASASILVALRTVTATRLPCQAFPRIGILSLTFIAAYRDAQERITAVFQRPVVDLSSYGSIVLRVDARSTFIIGIWRVEEHPRQAVIYGRAGAADARPVTPANPHVTESMSQFQHHLPDVLAPARVAQMRAFPVDAHARATQMRAFPVDAHARANSDAGVRG